MALECLAFHFRDSKESKGQSKEDVRVVIDPIRQALVIIVRVVPADTQVQLAWLHLAQAYRSLSREETKHLLRI